MAIYINTFWYNKPYFVKSYLNPQPTKTANPKKRKKRFFKQKNVFWVKTEMQTQNWARSLGQEALARLDKNERAPCVRSFPPSLCSIVKTEAN